MKKPHVKAPVSPVYFETVALVREHKLHTVCEEAACPNIGECWSRKHAAFMIMGDTCTRACRFCNIKKGKPIPIDPDEPRRVAEAVAKLGLKHAVITSVDRDDLCDGGAMHFADVIHMIRLASPETTIEVLTPDFLGKEGAEEHVVKAKPDVFNHNLETVPRLYRTVRPVARYFNSLQLLANVKKSDPSIFTKSGIMIGLGESKEEILQVMDDLRSACVDFITIGQYLQPTPKHHKVMHYASDEEFAMYEKIAWRKGFLMVSCSALTRSSHHAGEHFEKLRQCKTAQAVYKDDKTF